MAKRPRKYDKTKEVKAIARERIGTPPPERVLTPKVERKKPKHKKLAADE